jgi:hypothetical protein
MSGWQPPQRPPPGARVPPPPPAPPSKAFAIRTPHPLQAYPTTAHTQYAPGARPTQSQPPVTPPTTSRYFTGPTTRVFAPAVQAPSQQPLAHAPVVIQPAAVHVPPPPQLKAMFFSSQRASHLRALLHHAEKPAHGGSGSASSSLFRLPQIGLYELFTVKASSNLMPDLLATGLTSVAFVLITEKELEKEATRFAVVQR